MTQTQAFTEALILAIVAPSDEQSKRAVKLAIELSTGLSASDIDQCKNDALHKVQNP